MLLTRGRVNRSIASVARAPPPMLGADFRPLARQPPYSHSLVVALPAQPGGNELLDPGSSFPAPDTSHVVFASLLWGGIVYICAQEIYVYVQEIFMRWITLYVCVRWHQRTRCWVLVDAVIERRLTRR